MVMGLGAPMDTCPESLCQQLCQAGFAVIRYDNRDTGQSGDSDYQCSLNVAAAYIKMRARLPFAAPYDLQQLASDAAGLIAHLNLSRVHVVGTSMGGMISQILAAQYRHLVASVSLIMTSTNHPNLPLPKLAVLLHLLGVTGTKITDANSAVANRLHYWRIIQSPNYPSEEREIAARARAMFLRGYRPKASSIHNLALLKTGDTSDFARLISAPASIIHGDADKMVSLKGAFALRDIIKHAQFTILKGFGHELPDSASATLAALIIQTAQRGR